MEKNGMYLLPVDIFCFVLEYRVFEESGSMALADLMKRKVWLYNVKD
jgi:hypothetical protein